MRRAIGASFAFERASSAVGSLRAISRAKKFRQLRQQDLRPYDRPISKAHAVRLMNFRDFSIVE